MSKRFAILLLALPGCIYDAGECWVRGEGDGEAGVGGSVIVGAGAGGFGDVPPEPQSTRDAPDPCVQTVHCEITWKGGSGSCQSAGPAPTCSAYYRGEHRSLDEAKKACELSIGVGKNPDAGSCGPCEWLTSAKGPRMEKLTGQPLTSRGRIV